VLGVGGVAANSVVEHRELDRLVARVLEAQDTIAYSEHRVAATVDYTLPLLFSGSVPARVRTGLQKLVQESAAGQVDGVAAEAARTRQVSVVRWHRALRRARAALATYLDARAAFLRSVSRDSHVLYVEHPELRALLDRAREAFHRAAGPAGRDRIEAAFAGGTHPA
jgi:hypothetical protein